MYDFAMDRRFMMESNGVLLSQSQSDISPKMILAMHEINYFKIVRNFREQLLSFAEKNFCTENKKIAVKY